MLKRLSAIALLSVLFFNTAIAQDPQVNPSGQSGSNLISTGVPFLMIAPDARSGAMGDAGVSSSPDIYSMHWNPAKYAFIEGEAGIALSYSPWLKKLVPDLNLYNLNFYKRIDDTQTFAASLLYFSLGDVNFTDDGTTFTKFQPNEFSIDVAYARKLSENLSASIAGRFIYSDLTQGQSVQGQQTKAGISVAADVSLYWKKEIRLSRTDAEFAFGLNISNIGSKISYSDNDDEKEFIPTNLRFGPSLKLELDRYNTLTFMFDVNKLLVPTPPIYNPDNPGEIIDGKDPNVSVAKGIFQSFYDAPDGFKEELRELQLSFGVEYWYDNQFALRAGYFYEDKTKGNRKFFTVGAGLRYNVFNLDFSYLIPSEQQHPLEGTLRFSLSFDFEAFR